MSGAAVDHDGIASFAEPLASQRFSNCDLRVEAVAMLIERGNRKRRAQPHLAGIWRQSAGQHVDQSGLAAAVRSDDANAVTAPDAGRKIDYDRPIFIAFANAKGLDDLRAGWRRQAGIDAGLAGSGAKVAALLAQRL
jgi:hypothetical protein